MRAKIMLATGDPACRALGLAAQDILTELAVAFGHSFVMKEEHIGSASQHAYGMTLTQETVDEAAQCDAVVCISGSADDHVAIAGSLNCVLGCRPFSLPEALGSDSLHRFGAQPQGLLMFPLRTDARAMRRAAGLAHGLAAENQGTLAEIPFSGTLADSWHAATKTLEGNAAQTRTSSLKEALFTLMRQPENLGTVYGTPASCDALEAAAIGMSGLPRSCYYSAYWSDRPVVYGCLVDAVAEDSVSPFGVLFACADLLRHGLKLVREADCLTSSIINVLNAGWRTMDMPAGELPRVGTDAVCKLICEQIALAGQLMTK